MHIMPIGILVNLVIPGRGNLGYGKNFLATAFGGSSSGDGHLNPTTVSLFPWQSGTLSG